jgi:hypothetical protein
MKYLSLMMALALMTVANADELILKDGKKIEWKTLSDEGDSYEVTTPTGTKITVKKEDVDRLAKSRLPELLTGASFTFDKKRKMTTVDLLTKIDIKRDTVMPGWKLSNGVLTGTLQERSFAKLNIPYTPPEEYDLQLTIERKDTYGEGVGICVGLIGGGKQFGYFFERNKMSSGPSLVNGANCIDNGLGVAGKFFEKGKVRNLTFMVRRDALVVVADGKDYSIWAKPDWNTVSVDPIAAVPSKNTLFLSMESALYVITRAIVMAPKEQP